MRTACGSQERTWIVPTSLPGLYGHRKQHVRERNHREASATPADSEDRERANPRKRKSRKSLEALPGVWNWSELLELQTLVENSCS